MTKAKYLSLKGTSRGSPLTNLNTHPSIPSSVYNVAMGDVMNRARYGVKKAAKEVLQANKAAINFTKQMQDVLIMGQKWGRGAIYKKDAFGPTQYAAGGLKKIDAALKSFGRKPRGKMTEKTKNKIIGNLKPFVKGQKPWNYGKGKKSQAQVAPVPLAQNQVA